MTVASIQLKRGVLFQETSSGGGILMDVAADRFIALTPLSAAVWGGLSAGQGVDALIFKIQQAKDVSSDQARSLLTRQLQCWERAQLINLAQPNHLMPQPKQPPLSTPLELSIDSIRSERITPWLLTSLFIIELRYRKAMARCGLAHTLVAFQQECGRPSNAANTVITSTVRNYHALRRAFRQGDDARDCLFRSLALATVLQRRGVPADLCIGIVDLPFASHAWVEANGWIVNETLETCKRYSVIGRF